MAPQFHGRYSVGNIYFVVSPVIEGYEASAKFIGSGPEGMPEENLVFYVLYTKLPEPPEPEVTDPTEPEGTDPTEPETTEPTYDITEIPEDPRDPGYDLSQIHGGKVPLSGDEIPADHSCCILHFLIMVVAMILLGSYIDDRKKHQAIIHDMKRLLEMKKAAQARPKDE